MTNTKKKVLLIDDDPAVSAALSMLLKDEFDTHSAATVRDGVRLFNSLHPNVVVLDLHLPDSHGLQALRSIKSMDRSAAVVILTGFATLEVVEESMRLGACDCLHKPFDGTALIARLRELAEEGEDEVAEERALYADDRSATQQANALASSAFLHDITNPLTSLLAISTLLKDSVNDPHKCEQLASSLQKNIEYMSALVDQWRAFSAPETLKEEFASLQDIAERALDLVRQRANAKGVSLSLKLDSPEARPRLNHHAAVRILANLLQNAVEAVDLQGGEVVFRGQAVGDHIEFTVTDNGCGISPAATRMIFQPRYTTKQRGTGLGLYIARNIVEAAHGTISICSRPGRGTSFTVQLPAC